MNFAFYADEQYPYPLVVQLRRLGYDVLTVREDGRDNQNIDDCDVLARAIVLGRTVLTQDRDDYRYLHVNDPRHAGIVTNTPDGDHAAQALRIHAAISPFASLHGLLIRVVRPSRTP